MARGTDADGGMFVWHAYSVPLCNAIVLFCLRLGNWLWCNLDDSLDVVMTALDIFGDHRLLRIVVCLVML